MADNMLLMHIKSAIHEFYDSETGEVRRASGGGRELTDERLIILRDLFDLILNTKITNEETKQFLTNYYVTPSKLSTFMSELTGKEYNKNTCMAKIGYSKKVLTDRLGKDIIVDLIEYSTRDIGCYIERIQKARIEYSDMKAFDSDYILSIKEVKPSIKCVGDDKILRTLGLLRPYKKNVVECLINSIDKEALAYIKYIYGTKGLTKEEERVKILIEDYLKEVE